MLRLKGFVVSINYENIITKKNTLPDEIKENAYKSLYKESIDFIEKYNGIC